MANFVNVQSDKNEIIIDKLIDGEDFLGLNKDRSRLVPLGVSIGLNSPIALKNKKSLMRGEQVNNNNEILTMLTCAKIHNLKKDADLNEELAMDSILENADCCLNSGLDEIEEIIENTPDYNRNLRMIELLNEAFEKNVKKQ